MKYLIVQDWQNTHGNHAGMVHMCRLLENKYPTDYKVFVKGFPRQFEEVHDTSFWGMIKGMISGLKVKYYRKVIYPHEYRVLCKPMFEKLKAGDEVFLLEYIVPWVSQYELATYIRKKYPNVRIYALSHLTSTYFERMISNEPDLIQKWTRPVDKMLTLGTSLSSYFEKVGVPKDKISTGFHYVDSDYYQRKSKLSVHSPLRIITMGALQRDYYILSEVVKKCPNVHWTICRGKKLVDNLFPHTNNVVLKGYLKENELRSQMEIADVSLNIMEDTVGSNVITTSMAMGLAMIVTDVGSIRDYCDITNAVFCKTSIKSIVEAINILEENPDIVSKMKNSSIEKSKKFEIERVNVWFNNLNNDQKS